MTAPRPESDEQGPDEQGPDGQGPDGQGPDGQGPDGQGPDGQGPDGQGSDEESPARPAGHRPKPARGVSPGAEKRAPKSPARLRRWLKRAAIAALIMVAGLAGFVIWALSTCFAEPPEIATPPSILAAEVTKDANGRAHIGKSWFEQRTGRSLLYVEGDPFTIGYSNSALTESLLEAQERSLIENVRTLIPGTAAFYTAALLVLVHNRNLPDYVRDEYKLEIFGLSEVGKDPYPQFGSRYHRILNYHAAHDISHWIMDTPAIGCTAFAASGARTRDGHLIIGRNFDWESGEHFDVNKVIALYRPSQGHAFLSVSWPGMAGAVTGMNDAKIFCSINGAHTEHMGLGVGRPVSLVLREVLQYADDLEQATQIIGDAHVFVADSFLVADGKTGAAIVVEKTPKSAAVRPMKGSWILQSNHFETPELADDKGNLEYMRDGTSVARRDRLAELLARHDGEIDPTNAVAILRDRRGAEDAPRGLGNRGTINPMIATHAVVADATTGILWVSRGRHQLGIFDAYRIEGFGSAPATAIAADSGLASGEYDRLTQFRARVADLRPKLASAGTPSAATKTAVESAAALNPLDPEVVAWQAQILASEGRTNAAISRYRDALGLAPPFRENRLAIEAKILKLESLESR